MKQFQMSCRLVYRTNVTVEAETAEQAEAQVNAGEWVDDGIDRAELIDIFPTGKIKEIT